MKSKFKQNVSYIWLAPIITLAAMLVLYAFAGVYPFGAQSTAFADGIDQYIPFLSEFSRKIKEGSSLLFSWNMGGGTNFWAIIAYYLTSPLNLIALLFNESRLDDAFSIITLIKPVLMAFTFGIYLKHTYKKNDLSIAIFSFLWAVSAFSLSFMSLTSWMDAIIYFPLAVMGLKRLMDGKSAWMYSLFLGLTIAANFYIGWIVCVFCVIYFVYSLISDDDVALEKTAEQNSEDSDSEKSAELNIFEVFSQSYLLKTFFKFLGSSVLGAGISAIFVLPIAFVVGNTNKGNVDTSNLHFSDIKGALSLLASNIFPVPLGFDTIESTEAIFSFAGVITVILAVAYFFIKGISARKKAANALLILIMWASVIFEPLSFIWHGFSTPSGWAYRFAFVYAFVLLKIAFESFCEIKKIPVSGVICGTATACGLTACLYFTDKFGSTVDVEATVLKLMCIIAFYFIILLLAVKKERIQKAVSGVLFVAVIAETLVLSVGNINVVTKPVRLDEKDVIESALDKVDKKYENLSFVSECQGLSKKMYMFNALYGFKGYDGYSSVANGDYTYAFGNLGSYSNVMNSQNGAFEQDPIFNLCFPTSYYLDGSGRLNESSYRTLVKKIDGNYNLYKNNYTMPFMYELPVTAAKWDSYAYLTSADCKNAMFKLYTGIDKNAVLFNELNGFEFENSRKVDVSERIAYQEEISGEDANISEEYYSFLESRMIGYSYKVLDKTKPVSISFNSVAQTDGMMYAFVDTSELNILTVELNGKKIVYELDSRSTDTTVELGEAKKGDVAKITFSGHLNTVDTMYLLDLSTITAVTYTVDNEILTEGYNKLDAMSDTEILEFGDTKVKAKVVCREDGLLYIPTSQDYGWKIYIDGIQTELTDNNNGLLMTEITKGEHIVEMKYCPQGFVMGAVVTGVSVAILIAWAVISKKRNDKLTVCDTIDENADKE